jgi:site-specific DNA recombinase
MELMVRIRHVAIYLRKSRDDGEYEDALAKHRETLVNYANKNNWTYEIYEEIASGEKIEFRPKMQELLKHIASGLYDGVLVVDIDRLGRGDFEEWGRIIKVFLLSDTLIITPQRVYDPSEESDEISLDLQSFFAKFEYKKIKKRLYGGKVSGAKKGMWTNGKPPFPYKYLRDTKEVIVDESKRPVYILIKEMFLEKDMGLVPIARWLNQNRIKLPSGKTPVEDGRSCGWESTTVHRLLIHPFHMGYVVLGKSKGSGHKKKGGKVIKQPKESWTVGKGNHEILKTEEEHQRILAKLAENNKMPSRTKQAVNPVSGLLYCKKCGCKMQFRQKTLKDGKRHFYTVCVHEYPDGTQCEQVGTKLDDDFFEALYVKIIKLNTKKMLSERDKSDAQNKLRALLETAKYDLDRTNKALKNLYEAFEMGDIPRVDFVERRAIRDKEKNELAAKIAELEVQIAVTSTGITEEQLLQLIQKFKDSWWSLETNQEKNQLLLQIVDKIIYNKWIDGTVALDVIFK